VSNFNHAQLEVGAGKRVCPNPDNDPVSSREAGVYELIPLLVAPEFRSPILRISGRATTVNRAGMPKAAIDENGYSSMREDDIRAHGGAVDAYLVVLAVSASGTM